MSALAATILGASATAAALERHRVSELEAACFRAVNHLPDTLNGPVWAVMQLGALGAVPVTAAIAAVRGERRLATRLAVGGTAAWVLAKGVKRVVRRDRPAALVTGTRVRGKAATGGGFPSGHAAVAAALAGAALVTAPRPARPVIIGAVASVAAGRVYVGAHLPLDVLGGAALGVTIDTVLRRAVRDQRPEARNR